MSDDDLKRTTRMPRRILIWWREEVRLWRWAWTISRRQAIGMLTVEEELEWLAAIRAHRGWSNGSDRG